MSRVDEALKIAEKADGVVTTDGASAQPEFASAASLYPSETPVRVPVERAPIERASRRPNRHAEPLRHASRRSSPRSAPPAESPELQARLVTTTPNNATLEQYRRVAAVLHEEQLEHQLKTVMITSAVPSEGKTLTVVNLALTLSESYARRVLVIDADLRWPSLHTVLGVPNERGLSEALREEQGELAFTAVSSHLTVLTAGKPGPTPLAGLTSKRMGQVIADCAARFDWVLIDTPPVGVLPDAQVLVRLVGEIILVIGAGSTPSEVVEHAVSELGGPDAILGVVLNRVDEQHIHSANYYYQYGNYASRKNT